MDNIQTKILFPTIALRGVSVFPGQLSNFEIERSQSVEAVRFANNFDRKIFVVMQKDPAVDIPEKNDLYTVGTVCRIKQLLQLPGNSVSRVMVEGLYRAKIESIDTVGKFISSEVFPLIEKKERISDERKEALVRNAIDLYEEYIQANREFTPEMMLNLLSKPTPSHVSDYIAQMVSFSTEDKQALIEELRPCKRLEMLSKIVNRELNIMAIEKELNEATNDALQQSQREYFLHEEMKIIQEELGNGSSVDDIEEYRNKIIALPAGQEIKDKLLKDLNHLSKEPYGSAEASVTRSYIETCLSIPWGIKTDEQIDLSKARKILDNEHYGLEKVKERIVEYLAVKKLSPDIKGGLICLVGPPGTGKTSIAQSIAHATNRKLVRISLGGVHDEAEIRGHRKTYIGSMPGRIIDGIIRSKTCNPLMVLDEIDKLGSDYKGDPSSALLEVFDAEQNSSFRDNYLELPFDLSEVFFITTANTVDTIPRALLDRMEIIELHSYTDEEKKQIAKKYLLPKQRNKHGLNKSQLSISDKALTQIITGYTKESGVRVLERQIAKLCRKTATQIAENIVDKVNVKESDLELLLGPSPVKPDEKRIQDSVGLVRGLAWTEVGGEVLDCEVAVLDGSGKLELTGNLGDVMKESAKAAISYIRSRAEDFGIDTEFYKNKDIHIHFPEAAIPKDGPSAGVTVTTAIISALTGLPVRHDVAMTGEVTLRGRVLAIGGLREKTMAALRSGVSTVIVPYENQSDIEDIDPLVKSKLTIVLAKSMEDVIDAAFRIKPKKEITCQTSTSIKLNSLNQQLVKGNSSKPLAKA